MIKLTENRKIFILKTMILLNIKIPEYIFSNKVIQSKRFIWEFKKNNTRQEMKRFFEKIFWNIEHKNLKRTYAKKEKDSVCFLNLSHLNFLFSLDIFEYLKWSSRLFNVYPILFEFQFTPEKMKISIGSHHFLHILPWRVFCTDWKFIICYSYSNYFEEYKKQN